MSLTLQTTSFIKNFTYSHLTVAPTHFLNFPKFPNSKTLLPNQRLLTCEPHLLSLVKTNASFQESYGTSQDQANRSSNEFNLDNFLSVLEFLSLTCTTAISVYIAVSAIQRGGGILGSLGSKFLVWPQIALVSSVVFGAVIRRRQWRRICGVGFSRASSGYGANMLERVEKLEEDLRSSATIIRVLSRQLEKLGIRFRVTRKALKEPIAETAALAQKNSEATRALAAQEDNLEKELGEIQKVLMAMQEQQQKQLELILAIGKAGKLWETKTPVNKKQDENASEASKSSLDGVVNFKVNQIENNERP